ncbi:hypothetical protein XENOCAPTIV_013477, partial [Xenoophorus captivus]
ILVSQHAQFRKRCNAFFIDLVSTVCFKDNSPPCPTVILHLLSFLMVEASPVPILREVKTFAQALVTNRMGPLSVHPGTSGAQSVTVELTVHLAAILFCGNQAILAPLQQLALTPANMQVCCPNGHPCTIGEVCYEAELRLVKYLPDILTLQKDLVKKFQNNTELACDTISEFLHSQKAGEIKIPNEFCQNDLDLNSDFKVLLPQRQGPGLCSTALISYLIVLHNDLVYCVDKHTGEETSYKVSPADLTDLHVIRYELERDLMPLVLSNTQYSIEKGQETLYEYDLPKIQQQIISHFLLGKPLITVDTLTLFSVAGELHSYSEVCEALSTLEVVLGFLAMTGGEPHIQLSCYLEEVLQMGDQMAQHIVKVGLSETPVLLSATCLLSLP